MTRISESQLSRRVGWQDSHLGQQQARGSIVTETEEGMQPDEPAPPRNQIKFRGKLDIHIL